MSYVVWKAPQSLRRRVNVRRSPAKVNEQARQVCFRLENKVVSALDRSKSGSVSFSYVVRYHFKEVDESMLRALQRVNDRGGYGQRCAIAERLGRLCWFER